MCFSGQTVWITGASSGIGKALALALADQGARLVLSGRNLSALEAVAGACSDALVLPFEATDFAALPAMAEQAWDWSGGIDMLINNAGVSQRSLAVDTAFEVYQSIIGIDLLAPIALTQAILPRMTQRASGRIVMISSVAGKAGVPMRTGYCAAKFGLIGYADALRAETAQTGIRIHVIVPGSIRTEVSRNALTADGTRRGASDPAIDNGIDPAEAARDMLAAIARDEREIVIARGGEQWLGETTRTPDEVFDRMVGLFAEGYASKMQAAGE